MSTIYIKRGETHESNNQLGIKNAYWCKTRNH